MGHSHELRNTTFIKKSFRYQILILGERGTDLTKDKI